MERNKILERLLSLISVNEKGEAVLANPGEKEVFGALIQSVPDEVAQAWLSSGQYCEYPMNYYLRGKIGYAPRRDVRSVRDLKRPIPEVVAEFRDRKSGKRTEARNELQQRFQSLDWKEQLLVFETMLEAAASYKSYREWVYSTLRKYFWLDLENIRAGYRSRKAKAMKELAMRLCEEHLGEFHPALFAVKHFDLPFVQAHRETLIDAVGYYSVADRLMEDPGFVPERDLLAAMTDAVGKAQSRTAEKHRMKHALACGKAYYYLMAKHGRSVDEEEAREFLLRCIVYDDLRPGDEQASDFSLVLSQDMGRLLMNFGRLGFAGLIMEYHEMETEVRKRFRDREAKVENPWDLYLRLFRQEAISRYNSGNELEKLREENRLEYYKRLSRCGLPIDEHEAREFLAELVRDAGSLTLDCDAAGLRAEDLTLRLNHGVDELLNVFEQKGFDDALEGFAAFERDVMCRFRKSHGETGTDGPEGLALWEEFLGTAESELCNREHAEDNARQLLENNPEMKSVFDDFGLEVVRYDMPI